MDRGSPPNISVPLRKPSGTEQTRAVPTRVADGWEGGWLGASGIRFKAGRIVLDKALDKVYH